MDKAVQRHIVISAVNIRKGGTLAVLKDCLEYLSTRKDLRVTALVHSEALCHFDGISYIEIPWSLKGWCRRLWCEYVTMHKISKDIAPVDLWLSLHDTTPRVEAARQAVYCHTSFPFMQVRMRDFRMDWKIPMFARLTKYAYRINVRRNNYLIVQQDWLRDGLSKMTGRSKEDIIVARPAFTTPDIPARTSTPVPVFFYPSTPDCHKNFELACRAAEKLENKIGKGRFQLLLTLNGNENRYARWLKRKWGNVDSIRFRGFMTKSELFKAYADAVCLIFTSRSETWGLPISEFAPTGKPMILSDLPFAHESAAGYNKVAFVDVDDEKRLAELMGALIKKKTKDFGPVGQHHIAEPAAPSWEALFKLLLEDEDPATR